MDIPHRITQYFYNIASGWERFFEYLSYCTLLLTNINQIFEIDENGWVTIIIASANTVRAGGQNGNCNLIKPNSNSLIYLTMLR